MRIVNNVIMSQFEENLNCVNYSSCNNQDACYIRSIRLCACLALSISDPLFYNNCNRCDRRDFFIFEFTEVFCESCYLKLVVNTNLFNLDTGNHYLDNLVVYSE